MNSEELAKKHEACRLELYRDTQGVATIGWGTNIESISQVEADWLFDHRWSEVLREAGKFSFYDGLSEARQAVIENMIYNLGIGRFRSFMQMIKALEAGDFEKAAHEMLYNDPGKTRLSLWHKQVGYRAVDLANMMRSGDWLEKH